MKREGEKKERKMGGWQLKSKMKERWRSMNKKLEEG